MSVRSITIDGTVVTEIEMRDVLAKTLMNKNNGLSTQAAARISEDVVEAFFQAWRGGE